MNWKEGKYFRNGLVLFAFTISISQYVSVRILAVLLITVLIFKPRRSLIRETFTKAWDLIIYLVILAQGLLYSEDLWQGIGVLETNFSMLALPILFVALKCYLSLEIETLLKSFTLGVLIACLLCLFNSIYQFSLTSDFEVFLYYNLTNIIGLQPTYFAYYLIFSITYMIYVTYYDIELKYREGWLSVLIFFFLMLILTGGKTAYVSLLMIFSFFILKYFLDESTKRKRNVFFAVIILLIALFAANYINSFNPEFSSQNDYWERSLLWESAIAANPNPIFGVGTGDYKTILNAYYQSHGMAEFAKESFNSHNQFIQIYFSNGLIGLMVLVVLIGRPLYLSVRSQNTFGILVMFPFIIYGITEVFLGRYQGVVFFTLLHQVTIYQYYSTRSSFTLKEG